MTFTTGFSEVVVKSKDTKELATSIIAKILAENEEVETLGKRKSTDSASESESKPSKKKVSKEIAGDKYDEKLAKLKSLLKGVRGIPNIKKGGFFFFVSFGFE